MRALRPGRWSSACSGRAAGRRRSGRKAHDMWRCPLPRAPALWPAQGQGTAPRRWRPKRCIRQPASRSGVHCWTRGRAGLRVGITLTLPPRAGHLGLLGHHQHVLHRASAPAAHCRRALAAGHVAAERRGANCARARAARRRDRGGGRTGARPARAAVRAAAAQSGRAGAAARGPGRRGAGAGGAGAGKRRPLTARACSTVFFWGGSVRGVRRGRGRALCTGSGRKCDARRLVQKGAYTSLLGARLWARPCTHAPLFTLSLNQDTPTQFSAQFLAHPFRASCTLTHAHQLELPSESLARTPAKSNNAARPRSPTRRACASATLCPRAPRPPLPRARRLRACAWPRAWAQAAGLPPPPRPPRPPRPPGSRGRAWAWAARPPPRRCRRPACHRPQLRPPRPPRPHPPRPPRHLPRSGPATAARRRRPRRPPPPLLRPGAPSACPARIAGA